ncbi:L,D-transpeptidase [Gammaproteobacteria bacterium]|jgi:L,D-transpeptidase YbiS|nr:L,D-transpeptidase [Gammaproteobacteria bacterium]|tara:strand:- start:643 stop:1113 length:471 start_codon:yes stop_codon:yes gene_type:complete
MPSIFVSIADQSLSLNSHKEDITYPVSTAKLGPGEKKNSYCTPRGKHIIRAKIGTNASRGEIFKSRRATGEVFSKNRHNDKNSDWILTRILWLSGIEKGKNRLGNVDTMQRYIYIHGIPDEFSLNIPRSKGCINMNNDDVIELFDLVDIGTSVLIQ